MKQVELSRLHPRPKRRGFTLLCDKIMSKLFIFSSPSRYAFGL